ncbi:MAG TPA: large-conductance mechanosensitive channel protein MscL [Alphaproteobacteria bacterium]|nr:large-conductance mechanosensitive channel protein MscL [Alphaproteobacteria bacterium]
MSFVNEFKSFIMRGNVVDLAVGVVIGTAFGKIVSSLVDSIIMPVVGFLVSGVNISDLAFNTSTIPGAPSVLIPYGKFAQSCVDFLIVAFVIFMVVKTMAHFMPKPKPAPKGPSAEELLTQIRDLLKKKK